MTLRTTVRDDDLVNDGVEVIQMPHNLPRRNVELCSARSLAFYGSAAKSIETDPSDVPNSFIDVKTFWVPCEMPVDHEGAHRGFNRGGTYDFAVDESVAR